jgi:hypothetical protein
MHQRRILLALRTAACVLAAACVERAPAPAAADSLARTHEVAPPRPPDADPPAPDAVLTDAQEAADVLRRYYAAIDTRDYRRAYGLWGDDGAASGQSFAAFAAGFAATARVTVEIGAPSRVEPAAGSRYVEVPVVVRAVTSGGAEQRFEGRYTLRRSVVDGASPAQRRWHIHSARVERTR